MASRTDRLTFKPFCTIGQDERSNAFDALKRPLSGYLGGIAKAGTWVTRLQHEWANEFEVEHAVACNSATSGLLAACLACGIGAGDEVWTTCYSMSATAACAVILGARVKFLDIESETFGFDTFVMPLPTKPKAIIVTNLFGSPARDLTILAIYCRSAGIYLIEDNAQSPFAKIEGQFAGTIGDIGVFSLNVHKHVQAGEGGVCVTRDPILALKLKDAINHGELALGGKPGLNLRMTEVTAAIACAQLKKAHLIIARKIEFGETLTDAISEYKTIMPPNRRNKYHHVYYMWAALCSSVEIAERFADGLKAIGLPARHRYAPLLTETFHSQDKVPNACDIDSRLVCVECCAIEPTAKQLIKIGTLVKDTAEKVPRRVTVAEDLDTKSKRSG